MIIFSADASYKIASSIAMVNRNGKPKKALNIGALTKLLCLPGMEVTSLHWARISYLVGPNELLHFADSY